MDAQPAIMSASFKGGGPRIVSEKLSGYTSNFGWQVRVCVIRAAAVPSIYRLICGRHAFRPPYREPWRCERREIGRGIAAVFSPDSPRRSRVRRAIVSARVERTYYR